MEFTAEDGEKYCIWYDQRKKAVVLQGFQEYRIKSYFAKKIEYTLDEEKLTTSYELQRNGGLQQKWIETLQSAIDATQKSVDKFEALQKQKEAFQQNHFKVLASYLQKKNTKSDSPVKIEFEENDYACWIKPVSKQSGGRRGGSVETSYYIQLERWDTWLTEASDQKKFKTLGYTDFKVSVEINAATGEIVKVVKDGESVESKDIENLLFNSESPWNQRYNALLDKAFQSQERYQKGNRLQITTHIGGVERAPERHLAQFVKDVGGLDQGVTVQLLTDNLEQIAVDAGGPTQQYLGALAGALADNKSCRTLRCDMDGFLIGKTPDQGLSEEEKRVLQGVGGFFARGLTSRRCIGRMVSDECMAAVYLAAKNNCHNGALISEDMLLETIHSIGSESLKFLLSIANGSQGLELITDDQITDLAMRECCEIWDGYMEEYLPNVKEIRERLATPQGKEEVKKLVLDLAEAYRPRLQAAAEIAKGMNYSVGHSNMLEEFIRRCEQSGIEKVSTQIQGQKFDRKTIVQALRFSGYNNHVMQQEKKWLEEFIRQESENRVKILVKVITGNATLKAGGKLEIDCSTDVALDAHSCFSTIDFPTKYVMGNGQETTAEFATLLPQDQAAAKQSFFASLENLLEMSDDYDMG